MNTQILTEIPLDEFRDAVGVAHVSTALADRELCSGDVFFREGMPLAAAVIRPGSSAEVSAVVRIADRLGIPVAPRGGGVSYTRGYVPSRLGTVILDLSRLDTILELNAEDLFMTVGAGCTWQRAETAAAESGLRPVIRGPISGSHSTICGAVAQNAGPTAMAGILALEVVTGDGSVLRTGTSARAAHPSPFFRHFGPDLTGLFMGDTGTLGIKTRCTLALEPIPVGAAFASVSFTGLATMTEVMTRIARSGIPCRLLGMDPVKNRSAGKVDLQEGLGTLMQIVRSSASIGSGLRQAAKIARGGRSVLDKVPWSLHITVEGHDQAAADAALAALRPLWAEHGHDIAATVPVALRAKPFSIRGIVGPQGERWVPVHGIFPLSMAQRVVQETEGFFARHAERLQAQGIEHSFIIMTGAGTWLIEPMFYWMDELGPLHEKVLGDKFEKFRSIPPNPAARTVVDELRGELAALFDSLGGVHSQLGKYYPFTTQLDPATRESLLRLKQALDPRGILNPGNLGWE